MFKNLMRMCGLCHRLVSLIRKEVFIPFSFLSFSLSLSIYIYFYSILGKQRDHMDSRAAGLLHLINLLNDMAEVPLYVFLENVPGFETSHCHELLLGVLKKKQYEVEEYMVVPTDPAIGIPNRRRRYYLCARHQSIRTGSNFLSDRLVTTFEQVGFSANLEKRPFADYYDSSNDDDVTYQVPLDYIRSAKDYRFDIVDPRKTDITCATFTKAYGSKYVIGSGSLIQTKGYELGLYQPDDQNILPLLGLRFFSPAEIADLHALPIKKSGRHQYEGGREEDDVTFEFPDSLTLIQKYRLLGNGLNVRVVALLLSRLFHF
jgi:tRNA (cytosine38-C5)-methyltransferase